MRAVADSRRGNACGARRAVAGFEPAFVRLRNFGFRRLRIAGDKGNRALQSFARARIARLCMGVRLGKFQLALSHRERDSPTLSGWRGLCGAERDPRGACFNGCGKGREIHFSARVSFRLARRVQRSVYFG